MPSVARAGPQSGRMIFQKIRRLAGAVDAARVEQVPRQSEDELAHEEDAERADEERQEETGQGVDETGVRDEHEERHEGDDAGDHERAHDRDEDRLLAPEVEHRQGVAEHRAEDEVAGRHDDGDDDRVREELAEVQAC